MNIHETDKLTLLSQFSMIALFAGVGEFTRRIYERPKSENAPISKHWNQGGVDLDVSRYRSRLEG